MGEHMEKMKPCPRCGKTPMIVPNMDWDSLVMWYYPTCPECGYTTIKSFTTKPECVAEWNDKVQ